MSDLTDPAIVARLRIQAGQSTQVDIWDLPTYGSRAAQALVYHQALQTLMAAALVATPGTAQQAVYDAQVAKVAEIERFTQAAGDNPTSSLIVR